MRRSFNSVLFIKGSHTVLLFQISNIRKKGSHSFLLCHRNLYKRMMLKELKIIRGCCASFFFNKRTVLKEPKTRKGRCASFFYLVIL